MCFVYALLSISMLSSVIFLDWRWGASSGDFGSPRRFRDGLGGLIDEIAYIFVCGCEREGFIVIMIVTHLVNAGDVSPFSSLVKVLVSFVAFLFS